MLRNLISCEEKEGTPNRPFKICRSEQQSYLSTHYSQLNIDPEEPIESGY